MKRLLLLGGLMSSITFADTIDHYMNIANNIPQMEIKADPQAQAWARSARSVLIITSEGIADTLLLVNDQATTQGKPLFCLPAGTQLSGIMLNEMIQQTYKEISSQQSDKDKMTVSQVALLGIQKHYPCPTQGASTAAPNQPPSQPNPFTAPQPPSLAHVSGN